STSRILTTSTGARSNRQTTAPAVPSGSERHPCEGAVLLARLVCDAGAHRAEQDQARRLIALAPRRRTPLLVLWRAARWNGLASVERQADLALQALEEASPAVPVASVARTQSTGHETASGFTWLPARDRRTKRERAPICGR